MIFTIASAIVGVVVFGLTLLTAYLAVLTLAAIWARKRAPLTSPGKRKFALLVPAHNEEPVIERVIESLQRLDYPVDRFDICVVADNCTDATATIARSLGARVYERVDPDERAKGFALRWLLAMLRDEQRAYDAFAVIDADSVVDPNFLRCMDARLEAGSQVIQAYYSVQNANESAVAGLRYAALAAVHYVRPLGRSALGLSVGLKGNGMCFAADVVERFGWEWFTLAEDVEFHLALVAAGIRVDFAPEAVVLADMPVTLGQAASQNERWERGRLEMLRRQVPGLIREGVLRLSPLRLDAAIEQLIPPLSIPVALAGVCLMASVALGALDLMVLSGLSLVGQVGYLLAGLVMVKAPLRTYMSLAAAPAYVAWKLGLYARAVVGRGSAGWVRTTRLGLDPAQRG